jgi:hypothetical protein
MFSAGSVTPWLGQLQADEDAALSAFNGFCRGAERGRLIRGIWSQEIRP